MEQQQQQGMMVYRTSTDSPQQQQQQQGQGGCGNDVCQDNIKSSNNNHGQYCTCPSSNSTNTGTMMKSPSSSSSTTTASNNYLSQQHHQQNNIVTQQDSSTTTNQMEVTQESNSSILAPPLCPTPPPSLAQQLAVKDENLSYSWALITSPPSTTNQMDLPTSTCSVLNSSNLFTDMMMDHDSADGSNNAENNNYQHLGFIFHKPTSTQRFLDGQPRVRRRKSTTQKRTIAANSTSVTPTNYANTGRLPVNAIVDLSIDTINTDYSLSTPPSSAVSPHHNLPSSSTTSSSVGQQHVQPEPMDMQFDYLTEQLEILSSGSPSHQHHSNNNSGAFIADLANAEELTAILNNVLQKEDNDDVGSCPSVASSTYGGIDPMSSNNSMNGGGGIHSPTSASTSAPSSMPNGASGSTTTKQRNSNNMVPQNSTLNRSHCGSFVPRSKCCKPVGSVGGESVVITITPLTSSNNATAAGSSTSNNSMMNLMLEDDQQQKTTTRIVTCYCGTSCTCPGCLVHPGNFFLGSDPYAGLLNPTSSSSTSSSCYGSDEEGGGDTYSKSNNNNNFIPF